MAYVIRKNGTQHCVHNQATGKEVPGGCHPTREKALAHMRALYANVPDARPKSQMLPNDPGSGGTLTVEMVKCANCGTMKPKSQFPKGSDVCKNCDTSATMAKQMYAVETRGNPQTGTQFCVVNTLTKATMQCFDSKPNAVAFVSSLSKAPWVKAMEAAIEEWEDDHPFEWATVTLQPSGKQMIAAVARTEEQKVRGMIGRRWQNSGFRAMLFEYETPVNAEFHMNGVVEQLYIAWFDGDRRLVDRMGMFTSDPWRYRPARAFQYALEMPAVDGAGADQDGVPLDPGGTWAWLDGQTIEVEPFEPFGLLAGVTVGRDSRGVFAYTATTRTASYEHVSKIPKEQLVALVAE